MYVTVQLDVRCPTIAAHISNPESFHYNLCLTLPLPMHVNIGYIFGALGFLFSTEPIKLFLDLIGAMKTPPSISEKSEYGQRRKVNMFRKSES